MAKLELWDTYKSKTSNCYNTIRCDICNKKFKENDYCMSIALGYGKDDYVVFMCKNCWLGE